MKVSADGSHEPPKHRFARGEKDEIITQAMDCLIDDDRMGLEELFNPYKDIDVEVYIEVWYLFSASTRTAMKKLLSGEWHDQG